MRDFFHDPKKFFVLSILIISILINFLVFIQHSLENINSSWEIELGEGITLNEICRLRAGLPIYKNLATYPLIQVCYPPFSLWLMSRFVPDDPQFMFGACRIIVFISSLLVSLIIFLIIKTLTASRFAALIGLGIYFSFTHILMWGSLLRVDFPGIFFMMLSLYLFVATKNKNGFSRYIFAIPIILGILAKHSLVTVPAGIFVFCLVQKDIKRLAALVAGCLSAGVIFLIINFSTQGEFFRHIFLYTSPLWSIELLILQFPPVIMDFILYIPILLFWFGGKLRLRKKYMLLSIMLVFSFISLFAMGRVWCTSNFSLELFCILSIIIAVSVFELEKHYKNFIALAYVLLIIISSFVIRKSYYSINPMYSHHLYRHEYNRYETPKIISIIKREPENVLTQKASWSLLSGKEFLFDPMAMSLLSKKGLWDQNKFLADIKNKKFSLIVLRFDVSDWPDVDCKFDFTDEAVFGIKENYGLESVIYDAFIYKPKVEAKTIQKRK
ncbi:MAG: glycosyltransferase family 39 protein [bacterium]|nr:glycosyltransferase family 39 protein [bacterium]